MGTEKETFLFYLISTTMKQILRQTLSLAGALCLTIGGIAAQPGSFDSQKPFKTQYILGVNFVPEWQICHHPVLLGGGSHSYGFSPNFGLSFEARITRHSGVETGLYYREITSEPGLYTDGSGLRYPEGYRRYLSIPLLYKYYSRIVNVGVGVNFDFLCKKSNADWLLSGKHRVGIMLKLSKDITLYKGLYMEPEFHFNPFWEDGEINHSWIGLALGLKYRF